VINPRPMLSWRPTGRALGVQYALEVARADDPGFDDPVVSEPGSPGRTPGRPSARWSGITSTCGG